MLTPQDLAVVAPAIIMLAACVAGSIAVSIGPVQPCPSPISAPCRIEIEP